MKRLLAPLAITLGLVLVLAVGAFLQSAPPEHRPERRVASRSAGPAVSGVERPMPVAQAPASKRTPAVQVEEPGSSAQPAAQAEPAARAEPATRAEPAAQAETKPAEGPAVKTGCGRAVPCPNRDCRDCPLNRYLK